MGGPKLILAKNVGAAEPGACGKCFLRVAKYRWQWWIRAGTEARQVPYVKNKDFDSRTFTKDLLDN